MVGAGNIVENKTDKESNIKLIETDIRASCDESYERKVQNAFRTLVTSLVQIAFPYRDLPRPILLTLRKIV